MPATSTSDHDAEVSFWSTGFALWNWCEPYTFSHDTGMKINGEPLHPHVSVGVEGQACFEIPSDASQVQMRLEGSDGGGAQAQYNFLSPSWDEYVGGIVSVTAWTSVGSGRFCGSPGSAIDIPPDAVSLQIKHTERARINGALEGDPPCNNVYLMQVMTAKVDFQ